MPGRAAGPPWTARASGAGPRGTLPQVAAATCVPAPVPRLGRTHEDRFQRHELDTLPSALVELDEALVVLRANRAAAALVGVPAGELEGAAFAGLVAPEGRERADACLRALLCRSGPGSFDLDLVRARDREAGAGAAPTLPVRVKVGAGGRRGDAALVLALEGRPAPWASDPAPWPEPTPLDELPVAVLTVDARGRIQAANPAAEALLGAAPGALLGRPLDGVLPEGLGAGGLRHALRADGTTVPVDVSVHPRDTPDGPGAQAVLVDASERLDATGALERRARRQDELAALAECALAGVTPPELLERAAGVLAAGLEAELAAVLEVVPWQRRLAIRGTVGWPAPPTGGGRPRHRRLLRRRRADRRAPAHLRRVDAGRRLPGLARLRAHGVAAGLAVAVGGPAAPFAVLVAAARSPRRFDAPRGRLRARRRRRARPRGAPGPLDGAPAPRGVPRPPDRAAQPGVAARARPAARARRAPRARPRRLRDGQRPARPRRR